MDKKEAEAMGLTSHATRHRKMYSERGRYVIKSIIQSNR